MESINYKAIDFFCGGGGMTCGLRQAGIDVIAGVDFDENCKETYEFNNPGSTFIHSDITKLPLNYFEKKFKVKRNDDTLILIGCSPCQYYSIINTKRKKSKKSKNLLLDFSKFINYYNPGYVLVENVPGIETKTDSILPRFMAFLKKKGYDYIEKDVIDMSYYGVPQSRRRFSLIASRIKNVPLPAKEKKQSLLEEFIAVDKGFPIIAAGHKDETDFNHTVAGLNGINLRRLAKTEKDGGTRMGWKDDPELQLQCYIGKDDSFKDVYGRMCWKKPASTITTKFFNISNGRFAHPEQARAISLREGATLQTFPKSYVFKTRSIGATAKLIGNAVPPEYAKRVGEAIINSQQ